MKRYLLIAVVLLCYQIAFTQNIAINNDGSTPNPSAILDIKSTSKGLLMPRMTTVQRNAISTPAEGLKVYDTDTKTFWFYNGTGWIQSATGSPTNFWGLNGTHIFNTNAGNVGIGINTPLAPLHIKNETEALRIQGITPYISFSDNANTVKGFLQSFNNDLFLGTPATNTTGIMQFYLTNTPVMTMLPSGNVGIGSTSPVEKLTVQTTNNTYGISHRGEGGNLLSTYMGGTSAGIGTFSNTNMRIFANGNSAMFINSGNSYVGIGVDFPTNKLQVGSVGNTGYADNGFAIGNGTNAMRMFQDPAYSLIGSTTDIILWPKEAAGNVGINSHFQPTNKLQIGDIGGTGFAGNDLAIGNGTNALGIFQTNTATLIGSTTDIVLMPRNNGHGRVGINTNNPAYPLDVSDNNTSPSICYAYFARNGPCQENIGGSIGAFPVSIYAASRVLASEFDAYSDARIKNIVGISSTTKDLETINVLQITDYTMKDRVKHGNKPFKKVIAQDVEKVYPQVVSKHTDFIPNVYQPTAKVEKVANGYLLSFGNAHTISSNAKKLRVLLSDAGGMAEVDIVSIPSATQVIINVPEIKNDKVFVYGEEVDDFRTVDYEGLTTLNISATQELSKLVKAQQAMIVKLEKRLAVLETKK
jgi:Chaperone of endosialidase